jgi:hypothetical protein
MQHPTDPSSTSYQSAPALSEAQAARHEDGTVGVLTTPEGVTLEAEYRNGRFQGWAARDAAGQALSVTYQKTTKPRSAASLAQLRQAPEQPIEVCYVCFSNPVPTGPRILCYQIPCENLR